MTGAVYVHSEMGSNVSGDGTTTKPYKTLPYAMSNNGNNVNYICRGYFKAENIILRPHYNSGSSRIFGDTWGAAILDMDNQYSCWGWVLEDMIVINDIGSSDARSGVGVAGNINTVTAANSACCVAAPRNLVHECCLHWGCVGGFSTNAFEIYSYIKVNGEYKIWLGNGNYSPSLRQSTVYGVGVEARMKCRYGNPNINTSIFSKFAMIANDSQRFTRCIFAADCKWYVFDYATASSTYTEVTITGTTSEERFQSLKSGVEALGYTLSCIFNSCIFSTQTAAQLFNNAEKLDFTLKLNSDAIIDDITADGCNYLGALPPALNVPIMDDSTGVPATWDERSIEGGIIVDNNEILSNLSDLVPTGKIMSKIVQLDTSVFQIDEFFSYPAHPFTENNVHLTGLNTMFDENTAYSQGETLPHDWYQCRGGLTYAGKTYQDKNIVWVESDGTSFTEVSAGATLIPIVEPNTRDVLYCRCRRASTVKIKMGDGLQAGATYLNNGGQSITYRSRTIVDGESFVAMNDTDDFTAPSADYEISVMFDDTRVQSAEWIPASQWGEYFVAKQNGSIAHDEYGVPISSGNAYAFHPPYDALRKNRINIPYVQFALFVRYYN